MGLSSCQLDPGCPQCDEQEDGKVAAGVVHRARHEEDPGDDRQDDVRPEPTLEAGASSPRGGRSRSGAGEPGGDEEEDPDDDQQPEGPRISSVRMSHASFAAGRVLRSETSELTM